MRTRQPLESSVAMLVFLAGSAGTERVARRLGPGVAAVGGGRALGAGVAVPVAARHGIREHWILAVLTHALRLARLRHVLRPLQTQLHVREHAGHGIPELRQHLLEELEGLALVLVERIAL